MHPNYVLGARILLAIVFLIAGLVAADTKESQRMHWLGFASFASAVAFAWSAVFP